MNGSKRQTWIPNAFSLVQAVLCPAISSLSDTFQARKIILVVTCTISFVGAAIAPQSTGIARIISAQVLIGFGFAAVPLAYCVPSEILPRRWRPCKPTFRTCGICSQTLTLSCNSRASWNECRCFVGGLFGSLDNRWSHKNQSAQRLA